LPLARRRKRLLLLKPLLPLKLLLLKPLLLRKPLLLLLTLPRLLLKLPLLLLKLRQPSKASKADLSNCEVGQTLSPVR
jgi:hypothetical protein